jgi:hypothetical protein
MSSTDTTSQGNKEEGTEGSQKRNNAGTFPLLQSLDVKFLNISQKNIEYFDIHYNISRLPQHHFFSQYKSRYLKQED